MKKVILAVIILFTATCYTNACIVANAQREYMTFFFDLSAVNNSTFNFQNNSLGGKAVLGFGSYKDYFTAAVTFEMYGKTWGNQPIIGAKDTRLGLQLGLDPFAKIDRNSSVKFRIITEAGWRVMNINDYNCINTVYNGYGGRLEFGKGIVSFFIQDIAQFDYINYNYQWGNKLEVGLQIKVPIGEGKMYCK